MATVPYFQPCLCAYEVAMPRNLRHQALMLSIRHRTLLKRLVQPTLSGLLKHRSSWCRNIRTCMFTSGDVVGKCPAPSVPSTCSACCCAAGADPDTPVDEAGTRRSTIRWHRMPSTYGISNMRAAPIHAAILTLCGHHSRLVSNTANLRHAAEEWRASESAAGQSRAVCSRRGWDLMVAVASGTKMPMWGK